MRSAKATGTKLVNTMIRYTTNRGKFAVTGNLYMGTVMGGIVIIMIAIDC